MDPQSSSAENSYDDDVTSRQKLNLKDIDQGICFITGEKLPTKAIQDAHIIRRKLPLAKVERYERWWGLPKRKLNVDSRFNRVHLRADIHIAYDDDLWTFVPELRMLRVIEASLRQLIKNAKRHCIDEIVPKLDTNSRHTYIFVPIQPDAMSPCIYRLEDSHLHLYERPFHNFPQLSHHSHPYYVIVNAHSKFTKMSEEQVTYMPEEHRELMAQVIVIHSLWEVLGRSSPGGPTMKEDEHRDEHGHDIFGTGDAYQHSGRQSRWKSAGCEEKGVEDIDRMDYSDNTAQTAAIVHDTFSSTNTTNSIPASPLIPPSLESDNFIQPDDSASVTSSANTGLRSGYEDKGDEFRKDATPLYRHNVDYWRKNILQDMDGSPFLEDPMAL